MKLKKWENMWFKLLKNNMYSFVKKILFRLNPEFVHDAVLFLGGLATKFHLQKLFSSFYNYKNKRLEQEIAGMYFQNPVGLAAGFDKDAKLIQFLPAFGFGFLEVGSITYEPYEGNKTPHLIRLPDDKSILVNFGLKSKGAYIVAKNLEQFTVKKSSNVPIGISIAATNKQYKNQKEMAEEFVKAYSVLKKYGDYMTPNISCPKSCGGEGFCSSNNVSLLLETFHNITKKEKITKPIFLKLKIDLSLNEVDKIVSLAKKYSYIKGFVVGNLTKKRENLVTKNVPAFGGLSGKLCYEKAIQIIKCIRKKDKKSIIIGCGGVFTSDDAYEMLKSGANVIQLITGMIYNGPATVRNINKGIALRLEKEGYQNLSEAITVWHRKIK